MTPLQFATQSGKLDIIKFLLEKGADPNFYNEVDNSVLFYVIKPFGMEVNLKSKPWMIEDDYLLHRIKLLEILMDKGMKPNEKELKKAVDKDEGWLVPLLAELINVNNYKKFTDGTLGFSDTQKWMEKFRLGALRARVPSGSLFSVFTGLHQMK